MMFYNGFNLLIDLILCGLVFFFTRRSSWLEGYQAGQEDEAKRVVRSYEFYDQEADI